MVLSTDVTSTFVLDNASPEDVARAMIQSGRQKESFYMFDMDEAYHRISYFQKSMPRVKICYAMKSNNHDKLLKLAVAMGLGFDCASPGEIHTLLQLNVNPQSIIFAMPSKPPEWMTYARKSGVRHTTFDSSYQLLELKKHWSDAKLLLRIRVDGNSIYKLGGKFGCYFDTEAIDLLEEAASLNLQVVGIAFHVGSGCLSIDSHSIGLQRAKVLFDHEKRAGRHMYIVDIGGGFLSERADRIDQVSQLVNKTLNELFPDPNIQVLAEPGRYICDTAYKLYSNIISTRKTTSDNKPVNMVFLSDGIYGTLRYDERCNTVKIFNASQQNGEKDETYSEKQILWGPSADSTDRVMAAMDILLPECSPSDWLVFSTRGAYTLVFSSFFSCLKIPLIRSVVSKECWVKIRKSTVFGSEDFVEKPDFSTPLPSTLPPILPKTQYHSSEVILK